MVLQLHISKNKKTGSKGLEIELRGRASVQHVQGAGFDPLGEKRRDRKRESGTRL